MAITVTPYDPTWPDQFTQLATALRRTLIAIPGVTIEHVGSTSVPGLPAKPILDIDIIVPPASVPAAIAALESAGYAHQGDLGVARREAFRAPLDGGPKRNVYICAEGCLAVRNHLAVRDVLRADAKLRDEYARVKLDIADKVVDIDGYLAGKSEVLQRVLRASTTVSDAEREQIWKLNDPLRSTRVLVQP